MTGAFKRIIKMMHTSFSQWKANRDQRGNPRTEGRRSVQGERPMTVETKGPASPTGGVDSFSSMMRAERGAAYRPPSVVGSVRSFRSVRTTEEQIESLEARMDKSEETQKEINAKLDKVLALLAQVSTQSPNSSSSATPRK